MRPSVVDVNSSLMDRLVVLQFFVILLVVPLQLFIASKWSYKNSEQIHPIYRLSAQMKEIVRYFSPKTWFHRYLSFVIDIPISFTPSLHKQTWRQDIESPAVEVFHFREQYGYFATSPTTRSPRANYVKFRIGQVIRHKIHGYRAVIIGWDETARASNQWLKEHSKYTTQPAYSVLPDTRDQRTHKIYILQEHIEVITNTKIVNAQLSDYFNFFDGSRYMTKPWLREQYPHD